jgi:Sulfatase
MLLARMRRWVELFAALLVLDVSLTFTNVWPTPAIHWRGQLSIELAVCVIALVAGSRWHRPSPIALAWLSALWTALVIGRYAQVTAPALYGRDVNLYWDLHLMPDVAAMVTRVAPWWLIVTAVLFVAFCFWLLYRGARWAIRVVADASAQTAQRRALAVLGVLTVIVFAGERLAGRSADLDRITPTPVTHTYARQVQLAAAALASSHMLAASPLMDSDFGAVSGADIFLIFIESYGAVSFDRPEFAAGLAARRAQLEKAIRHTHRTVASAFVESPTFGGGSWLAHLSLLSGVEVRDPDTNALLMTQNRDTLARSFGRRGFRTVALMPGLRQTWPEGTFYGFDRIYGAEQLAYRGPEFGWFAIPDQFSLDRLDTLEVAQRSRPPLFVFFPTISTHFPFRPTPPYQPDWRRISTPRPYDGPDIVRAYAGEPDWTDFGPGYVEAMAYDFATIEGYLRERADRDFVMILIGDHQPPAAVSGEGAPWDVPVHVIASRKNVIDGLIANGFRTGLTPARPTLTRMHALLPLLLDVFGVRAN